MLRIAICDDADQDRERACRMAEAYFKERGREIAISVFTEAGKLLEEAFNYDLYLLDVIMPDMTGLQAAERLNQMRKEPVIVFITSSLEAAVDGYRVCAAGFLLKPVEEQNFMETMERVETRYLASEAAVVEVIHNRVAVPLFLDRIVYLESRLHQVIVNLTDGESLTLSMKLQELQGKLEEKDDRRRFLRCHQSYLVNLQQVREMGSDCFITLDGRKVPISRTNYRASKNLYYHYLLK